MKTHIYALILVLFITGCANKSPEYILLKYSDFGPQAIAYKTIGYEWYQWGNSGSGNPKESYNIKVVVYRNITLKKIKKLFPVSEKEGKDFRYIEYTKSINYLNEHIKELKQIKEPFAKDLSDALISIQNKIRKELKTNEVSSTDG